MSIENSFIPSEALSPHDGGGGGSSSGETRLPLSLGDRVNSQADYVLGELGIVGMAFNTRGFQIYREEGSGDHKKLLPRYDQKIMEFIRAYFACKLKSRITPEHQREIPDLSLDTVLDTFDPEGNLFSTEIIGPQGTEITLMEVVKVLNGQADALRKPH
ncbi:MAG: hypothetical protein AAB478_05010 [Patescibacteria group bacterium]